LAQALPEPADTPDCMAHTRRARDTATHTVAPKATASAQAVAMYIEDIKTPHEKRNFPGNA
jgi:hypothetical protein